MIVGGIGKFNISLVNKVKLYCFSFSFEESREFPSPSLTGFRKSPTNRARGDGLQSICGKIHTAHADGINLLVP